jgi:hypothetical protein
MKIKNIAIYVKDPKDYTELHRENNVIKIGNFRFTVLKSRSGANSGSYPINRLADYLKNPDVPLADDED